MSTRVLYVDDSGKPDAKHSSKAVTIAGFAIDAETYPQFSRRVLGAKKRFFPGRGLPQAWEIKSTEVVKPNPWKRSKNRGFCEEIARLLDVSGATVYAATIVKSRMHHPMSLATTMPLQMQVLVEHFAAECEALDRTGMLVADWSSHHFDRHASQCVASFAASHRLRVHPGVYYASSHSCEGTQIADLIAGVRRRTAEGSLHLDGLDVTLSRIRPDVPIDGTTRGRPFRNWIDLF